MDGTAKVKVPQDLQQVPEAVLEVGVHAWDSQSTLCTWSCVVATPTFDNPKVGKSLQQHVSAEIYTYWVHSGHCHAAGGISWCSRNSWSDRLWLGI